MGAHVQQRFRPARARRHRPRLLRAKPDLEEIRARPRDGEETAALILGIIDDTELGRIVSIAVTGVRIVNPHMPRGLQDTLPHAPVTSDILAAAAIELLASDGPTADHPRYAEAYRWWREPYDAGKSGVFTITIPEILDIIEAAIRPPEGTA